MTFTVTLSEVVATGPDAVDVVIPLTVTGGTEVGQATKGTDFTLPD